MKDNWEITTKINLNAEIFMDVLMSGICFKIIQGEGEWIEEKIKRDWPCGKLKMMGSWCFITRLLLKHFTFTIIKDLLEFNISTSLTKSRGKNSSLNTVQEKELLAGPSMSVEKVSL